MIGHHGRRSRRRFDVSGVVQGVGSRPFVYSAAAELELTGTVHNDVAGVVIDVEGLPERLIEFDRRLTDAHPPLAVVESVVVTDLEPRGGTGFTFGASAVSGGQRTFASSDVATCDECVAELRNPKDRRFRHPFITCTNCGPRFTIITDLPYNRASTTMVHFPMCEACRHEYEVPADRRFHAQPIACHDCGPTLRLVSTGAADELGEQALSLDPQMGSVAVTFGW